MEVTKLLKNVKTLNEYITVTQDVSDKYKNMKIQFNMSTVLSLKKVRSIEIEYFNKSEGNGAACILLERMLALPPSKTWGVLGKEMASLLQYWLDAVRKHLISHNVHWWTFLKLLLQFIKTLKSKDTSMPNILVEHTAESLLDLASHDQPDGVQRRDILACLNVFCAEAGREIRLALRKRFAGYFTKLSVHLASSPVPCQYSILETLLRWLLPRHEPAVRMQAAAIWFPTQLYSEATVDMFLDKHWMDFFQDARDFLNVHNSSGELVTSVVCRELVIGNVTIVSSTRTRETWLDINTPGKCLSVLLDPKQLEAIGTPTDSSCEALIINNEGTLAVQMLRDTTIKITLKTSPGVTSLRLPGCEDSCDVTITISSRSDLARVHRALTCVFQDKYQLLLDLNSEPTLSPDNSKNVDHCELDTRFSHPVEVRRRKHSGYIASSRVPAGWNSPSTASTTSLAQLHDKLESLPHFRYDKEPVSVCARPALSSVTEVSEVEDRQSVNTTLKLRPYGVCQKNFKYYDTNKKSQSDGDVVCRRQKVTGRHLSPVVNENTPSCLLVATIGSVDSSIINDTVERISKSKEYSTDNIVDLLVQEALGNDKDKDKLLDSGINTGDNKKTQDIETAEEIENTPGAEKVIKKKNYPPKADISPSDESNTEVINDTPFDYVSVRRKNRKVTCRVEPMEKASFDIEAVEQFFSQHFTENKVGDIVISPTLAKKINETSSEASEDFEYQYLIMNENDTRIRESEINEIDIIECLNSMVDKVCNDFDKCTEYFNQDNSGTTIINDITKNKDIPLQVVTNTYEQTQLKNDEPKTNFKGIKLKYRTARKSPKRNVKRARNKKTAKTTPKMSTIIEDINDIEVADEIISNDKEIIEEVSKANDIGHYVEVEAVDTITNVQEIVNEPAETNQDTPKKSNDPSNPKQKRKRKLYSPKDEHVNAQRNMLHISETEDDDITLSEFKSSKSKTKSTATCYKDIEKDRKRIRQPRYRKSNRNVETPSPRATKMNVIFDKLKQTVESTEKITLVDKNTLGVFNFSGDSDNDDFKIKKIDVNKRNSNTTIGSFESAMSLRNRKGKKNYTENTSSNEGGKERKERKKKTPVKRKRATKRKNSKPKENSDVISDLVDERMREQPADVLNTSFVAINNNEVSTEPKLVLDKAPELELITEENVNIQKKKPVRKNKNTDTKALEITSYNDNDRTESPLPGLVVESAPAQKDDTSSVLGNMLSKFKRIYEEGPDAVNETNTTQNMLSDMEKNNLSITNPFNNDELDQIEEINEDNVTNYPKLITNSSKTKNNRNKKQVKERYSKTEDSKVKGESILVVDITNSTDIKSIPSDGITGHGVSDEAPPDPKSIREIFRPRSIEIEDLDQSMKEYFKELTNEMNTFDFKSANKTRSNESKEVVNDLEKSPVVAVARLSFDDISRWLPSRRTSDSSEYSNNINKSPNSVKSNEQRQQENDITNDDADTVVIPENVNVLYKIEYTLRDSASSDSNKIRQNDLTKRNTRGNTKSKTYDSNSRDLNNRKRNNNTNIKRSSNNSSDEDLNQNDRITDKEDIRTVKESNRNIAKNTDTKRPYDSDSDNSSTNERVRYIKKQNKGKDTNIDTIKRKSMISPIKLFDDYQMDKKSQSSNKKSQSSEECIRNIRSLFSKERSQVRRITRQTTVDNTSVDSKASTPTKGVKRKASPVLVGSKRQKAEVINVDTITPDSGPSIASVADWFARNEPANEADRFDAPFTDSIHHVMEKLDTTLMEIHQNTNKRLVRMLVDAQKHLAQLKDDRRAMYQHVAKDIFAAMVQIIDEKFADLDKRSQHMDTEFMATLKKQAAGVIKEDCKQKHAMVMLLKEDVQAVIDHIHRSKRSDLS